MTAPTFCPWTDAVVAHHLDGCAAAADDAARLAEHVHDCPDCRLHLQRCRRLDAALAGIAGRATAILDRDPSAAEEWLHRAASAATKAASLPASPAEPLPRRRVRSAPAWIGAAAAAVLVGWLGMRGPTHAPERSGPVASMPPAEAAERTAATPGVHPGDRPAPLAEILLPATRPASNRPTPPRPAALALVPPRDAAAVAHWTAFLTDPLWEAHAAAHELLRGPAPGLVLGSAATTTALRVRAAAVLLDSGRHDAELSVVRWLGRTDAGAAHDLVLFEVRQRSETLGRLARRVAAQADQLGSASLDTLADVTAAARLGGRRLEDALRRATRRQPALLEAVAASLRAPAAHDGRARLLLDLWGDAAVRGLLRDDPASAARLFAGQPAGTGAELIREFDDSRSAERRMRCLLALGILRDPASQTFLVRQISGPVRPEAIAATWCLARLPAASLRPLLQRAVDARQWLLRCALIVAEVEDSLPWLSAAGLDAHESALVRAATASPADLERAAGLLRTRALPPL